MKLKTPQSISSCVLLLITTVGLVTVNLTGCAGSKYQESTGQFVDDAAITAKIKAQLLDDPTVGSLRISVETYKGHVQLSGFANSKPEREQAGKIARQTAGVTAVKNDILLK